MDGEDRGVGRAVPAQIRADRAIDMLKASGFTDSERKRAQHHQTRTIAV